jgi:hypothetical protein
VLADYQGRWDGEITSGAELLAGDVWTFTTAP